MTPEQVDRRLGVPPLPLAGLARTNSFVVIGEAAARLLTRSGHRPGHWIHRRARQLHLIRVSRACRTAASMAGSRP